MVDVFELKVDPSQLRILATELIEAADELTADMSAADLHGPRGSFDVAVNQGHAAQMAAWSLQALWTPELLAQARDITETGWCIRTAADAYTKADDAARGRILAGGR